MFTDPAPTLQATESRSEPRDARTRPAGRDGSSGAGAAWSGSQVRLAKRGRLPRTRASSSTTVPILPVFTSSSTAASRIAKQTVICEGKPRASLFHFLVAAHELSPILIVQKVERCG
jgi:hypothetical protein